MEYHKHFRLNSMLRYITLTLFIASTIKADILVPNYDVPSEKVKFFEARSLDPLLLHCNITVPGNHKLKWAKNGTEVSKLESLKNRYEIHDKENNLIIKDTSVDDAGTYTCSAPDLDTSATIEVIANVYLKKVPDNMAVVEGEKLQIHCKALGTDPKITWSIGNDEVNRSRVILEKDADDVEDAILIIEHAELTDRNFYNCTARNKATESGKYTEAVDGSYVRVKGKLAALWPFLGICAEVFILCAIILVYEKRRNKEGLDESDTDQSPEQEKLKTGK